MTEPRLLVPEHRDALSAEDLRSLYERPDRSEPWLRMDFVSSLDGAVTVGGLSGGLGTPADHAVFGALRTLADVVVVGAGTVRAEGYGPMRVEPEEAQTRLAHGLPENPVFAIVSSSLGFDPADRIFSGSPVRPILVTSGRSDPDARAALSDVADIVVCGDERVEGQPLREALASRGLAQMLCEGGPHLFGSLLEGDAVDELCLTISPLLVGGPAGRIVATLDEARRTMRLGHVVEGDGTLLLRYERPFRRP